MSANDATNGLVNALFCAKQRFCALFAGVSSAHYYTLRLLHSAQLPFAFYFFFLSSFSFAVFYVCIYIQKTTVALCANILLGG